jgi:hypothetical protein
MSGRINRKLLATFALTALCASMLVLTASPAGAKYDCEQSLTTPPGDTPNEANGGDSENMDNLDIISAGVVADDGTTMKVAMALKDMSMTFPTNATSLNWFFQWTYADVSYYARASVSAATPDSPSFVYGTYNPTTSAYTSTGTSAGSMNMGPGGRVEIEVPYEGVGAPTAGQTLTQVFAKTYVGQGVPGGPTTLVDADRGPKAEESFGANYTLGSCGESGGTTLATPKAGLGFNDKTPKRGQEIVATANLKVCGAHAGTKIQLQRKVGGSFKKIASKTLSSTCRAKFTVKADFKSAVFRSFWAKQDDNHRAGRSTPIEVTTH